MKKLLLLTCLFFILSLLGGQGIIIAQTISSQKGLTTAVGQIYEGEVIDVKVPNIIRPGDLISGIVSACVTDDDGGQQCQDYTININKPNIPGPAGLKVNSYSGALFYQRTDLVIPGKGPSIDFTFYYNSATTTIDLGYGPGWSMTYSMEAKMEGVNVAIRRADGRKDLFLQSGPGYTAPVGIFDNLVQYLPGKFQLTTKTGMNYFFDDPSHKRLTKITDPNNNQLNISYTSGLPTAITDASGRTVTLNYTLGHLTTVTDPNFSPARQISFVYDASGNPVQVTDPLGNNIFYNYDAVRNMTMLTDQAGNIFNINYQNCIHVVSITSPLSVMLISYDNTLLKTTVIESVNSINQSTTYQFNAQGNLQEMIGNCCGFHQQYIYDAQNNVTQRTDANGNIYTYTYDAKGNMLSETDPLAGVRSYVYEPVFNRVTSATDKNGNITTYAYDANGNLLTINRPLGITELFTYAANGNVLSYTDGRGFTTLYAYNAYGDRTLITYPGGATNSFTYDDAGNLLTSTDANGNPATYEYDKLNRLKKATGAIGNITNYAYDSRSNMVSVTDPLGHLTTYAYDALNRRISTTTPSGTSSMTNDEKGNVLTSTDNNGNVTTYTYNTKNLLVTETNALGNSRSFTYDANGNLLTETDFNSNPTTYIYDALNRVTQRTNALSQNTTNSYDANSNLITVTDANANTTVYIYDALNRPAQILRPIGINVYAYDANGNRTSTTDANGNVTTFTYDNRNRNTIVTDALLQNLTYMYDAHGNLISSTDRNGNATTYTYDALNRNVTSTNPALETTTTVYDAEGKTVSLILPTGNTITYSYDAAHRLITVADILGTTTTYSYDANSNQLTQTDALAHTTSFTYDALNRTTVVTDPLAQSKNHTYDNNSNLLSMQDRNGNITSYLYDALNRKIRTTYPAGNKMFTFYDPVGNTASMKDDNNNITSYVYDVNDRLTTTNYPDGSTTQWAYDAAGNTTARTDNNGNITTYAYDALDRLVLRNYPGPNDDVFSYDFGSRMITANNSNANITFTYDNANRMLSENMNGKTTSYVYDIPNRKRFLTYPGGRNIEENYDVRMRLALIKDGPATLSNYNYDPADRLVNRSCGNGTFTNYSYNNNDWNTVLTHSPGIGQFNYSFDNEGNRLFASKSHRPTNSEKYVYDINDRLANYKEGTLVGPNIPAPLTQTQFNYDGVGNRTTIVKDALTTTYTTNMVNEYTNINSGPIIIPTYDANGNTLSDGVYNYQYDFENRLINVNGGAVANYKYDALGRRIQKLTPASTINYFYASISSPFGDDFPIGMINPFGDDFPIYKIVEERDGLNVVQATYVFGDHYENKYFSGTHNDDLLNMKRGGVNYFYHQNSLGSVFAVTNNTGNVAERYEYDAYGKPTIYNGAYVLLPATNIGNTYMFSGMEYNAETVSYHSGAGFYKPDWGRFGQRYDWDFDYGSNYYTYFNNNPIQYTNPTGDQVQGKLEGTDLDQSQTLSWAMQLHEDYNTSNDPFRPQLNVQAQVHYESIPVGTKLIFTFPPPGNNANPPESNERKTVVKDFSDANRRLEWKYWGPWDDAMVKFWFDWHVWIARQGWKVGIPPPIPPKRPPGPRPFSKRPDK